MKNLFTLSKLTVLTAGIFIASCGPAPKLALTSEGWKNQQEIAVVGKKKFLGKQSMSIGDIKSQYVKRSWTKGSTRRTGFYSNNPANEWNLISNEYITRRQSLHFQMNDGKQNSSDVYCLTNVKRNDLIVGKRNGVINTIFDIAGIGDSESNLYAVQVMVNDVAQPYELLLDNIASQRSVKDYVGQIVQGSELKYSIVPTNKLVGKHGQPVAIPFGSVGYELKDKNNRPVAAISFMGKPVVYLNEMDEKERFVVTNLCAAILLREEI